MRISKAWLLLLCLLFTAINSASAESKSMPIPLPTPAVPYGVIVHSGWGIADEDLETACSKSLEAAAKKCEAAGGKFDGLTNVPPDIYKGSISHDGVTTPLYFCNWNVGCVFPSKELVPYHILYGL